MTELDTDKLWEFVKSTYYSMPLDTIARSFTYHTQMANAIHSCHGGDEYATSSGRHCGVRRMFVPTYRIDSETGDPIGEPVGVDMVEIPDGDNERPSLKYDKPIVASTAESLAKHLTIAELDFFESNLEKHTDQWQRMAMAITIQQEQDGH